MAMERRLAIVKVPDNAVNWPTINIGFYRSSGGGNSQFNNAYVGVAIPFFGHNPTEIIKSATLLDTFGGTAHWRRSFIWINSLISLIFGADGIVQNQHNEIYNTTPPTPQQLVLPANTDYIVPLKTCFETYFNSYWQLQISAFMGDANGGTFWANHAPLRNFILNHDIGHYVHPNNNCINSYVEWTARTVAFEPTVIKNYNMTPVSIEEVGYGEPLNNYLRQHDAYAETNAYAIPIHNYRNLLPDINCSMNISSQTSRFDQQIRTIRTLRRILNQVGGKYIKSNKTRRKRANKTRRKRANKTGGKCR